MANKEYHKIENIFERDMEGTKKLIEGAYRNPTVEYLRNCEWIFTEKIDGTNIRICWIGHKVSFRGRTDNAQIHKDLYTRLEELFGGDINEQLFEQKFGDKEVTLYGEGYGVGIQAVGKDYLDHKDFILFDVLVGDTWLSQESVEEIAKAFYVPTAPVILKGTLADAVEYVKTFPQSTIGTCEMEGVIGRPAYGVKDNTGKRIIVKIKCCDFKRLGEK